MGKLGIFAKFKRVKSGAYVTLIEWWDMGTDVLIREHIREWKYLSKSGILRTLMDMEVSAAWTAGYTDIYIDADDVPMDELQRVGHRLAVDYPGRESEVV